MADKLEVHFRKGSTSSTTKTCDFVNEGENGVFLMENPGPKQVGYIPYDALKYIVSNEADE